MRRLLTSTPALTLLSVSWAIWSALHSSRTGDWVWFQRSGSILTFAGACLSARAIVRLGRKAPNSSPAFGKATLVSSAADGRLTIRHSAETVARRKEAARDAVAAVMGFVLAALGTLIWGYGDLVGKLPQ
jgi:hypothetical protein